MEFQYHSHSRNKKGKRQKQDIKFLENSSSINSKKHKIHSKKAKELSKFEDKNGIDKNDYCNQHQKDIIINKNHVSKSSIINSESSDYSYADDSLSHLKIAVSQPLPRIFSIEEEYFYENNPNHYDQQRSSIDDFDIFVPYYKNGDACLKNQDINSHFSQAKKHSFGEKQMNLSTSSASSVDFQETNDSSFSNLVFQDFIENEENRASSTKAQIPQIGYYKLERAESFNTHDNLHYQNISKEEKKRKIQTSKSSTISGFKNQIEIAKPSAANEIIPKTDDDGQTELKMNKKADRYGWFITKNEIMTPQNLKILQTESLIEFKREQKWIKMIKNWDYFMTNKLYKIKSRVKKGIPDCLRSKVWQLLLDPESCSTKQNEENQVSKRPSIQSYILIGRSKCCKTIEADLHRTMPHVKMFCDESAINSLREILHAYSNKDTETGYYQGMAFLAAILLVYLDEVQAFWCFVNLMNGPQLQFRSLFIHKFSGLNKLNELWEKLLALKFPKVAHNLVKENIVPVLYTPAWFLCSYLSLPFEPTLKLRIFDRTLMFGARAILSFGLAIIALNKKMLETEKATKILLYLQHPDEHEAFKDWRNVISKFDEHWLSQSDYDKLFKITNIPKFF